MTGLLIAATVLFAGAATAGWVTAWRVWRDPDLRREPDGTPVGLREEVSHRAAQGIRLVCLDDRTVWLGIWHPVTPQDRNRGKLSGRFVSYRFEGDGSLRVRQVRDGAR